MFKGTTYIVNTYGTPPDWLNGASCHWVYHVAWISGCRHPTCLHSITLICMLLGPSTSVSKEVLLDTFLDFVSSEETSTCVERDAFPHNVQDCLKCCVYTTKTWYLTEYNWTSEFIHKPVAAIALVNSGTPVNHKNVGLRNQQKK